MPSTSKSSSRSTSSSSLSPLKLAELRGETTWFSSHPELSAPESQFLECLARMPYSYRNSEHYRKKGVVLDANFLGIAGELAREIRSLLVGEIQPDKASLNAVKFWRGLENWGHR